ncbi:MAG: DUF6159 family protein [Candidatus Micrarchaeota archaeon]
MFESIGRSWSLFKKSFELLMLDKELLVFPILSGFFGLLLLIAFIFPLFIAGLVDAEGILFYVILFLFYFAITFIVVFFNAALVGAANIRLNGGNPKLGDGIRIAFENLGSIIGWSLISATIGVILSVLSSKTKDNFIGQIVTRILGAAWSIITFFVIPIMVIEKTGPVTALKRSGSIVKDQFGETMIAQFGFGAITGFGVVLSLVLGVVLFFLLAPLGSVGIGVAVFITLFLVFGVILLSKTLNGIFIAALYHYATTGEDPENWNLGELVESAQR